MPAPVPGLRSPYDQVGGLYAIGRMFDKIRLHLIGQLPEAYHANFGDKHAFTLDARCCRFLGVTHDAVREQVQAGRSDEELFQWAIAQRGTPHEPEEVEHWNAFFSKRGWRDETSDYLRKILVKDGFAPDATLTFFDHMDLDECRPLRYGPDPVRPASLPPGKNRIEGLRSPHDKVGGIVHFGRMLDKIRLAAAGKLPPEWNDWRGTPKPFTFDGRVCRFLKINYQELEAALLKTNASDDAMLDWAFAHGRKPSEEQILIWNAFMTKLGWRDALTPRVHFRLQEAGLPIGSILTSMDYIDWDEGKGGGPGPA